MNAIVFMPRSASTLAPKTDAIYLALVAVSVAILFFVFALIVIFAYRYRRGSAAPRGALPAILQHEVEIGWTATTAFTFLFFFWWAGSNEISELLPPRSATEIHVVAKQWMWKVQHPNGAREIDMLHVPVGEAIRLVMTSQDVIHSFSVPDFRIKSDILPGRYVEIWFEPTQIGTFRLYCTQFCGTAHSAMTGSIVAMSKPDFAAWLRSRPGGGDLVAQGRELFVSLSCAGCHTPGGPVHAPNFEGLFGRRIPLASGKFVLVDDAWIRDCILGHSKADPPAGYPPIMPNFTGEVDDGQILALSAYIRSLSPQTGAFR